MSVVLVNGKGALQYVLRNLSGSLLQTQILALLFSHDSEPTGKISARSMLCLQFGSQFSATLMFVTVKPRTANVEHTVPSPPRCERVLQTSRLGHYRKSGDSGSRFRPSLPSVRAVMAFYLFVFADVNTLFVGEDGIQVVAQKREIRIRYITVLTCIDD